MTQELTNQEDSQIIDPKIIENLAIGGDLSGLNSDQKVQYFQKVCESLGLNPLTKPFEVMNLQGKEVLYAKRDATDQLRKIYKISVDTLDKEVVGDQIIVTCTVSDPYGRTDSDIGMVPLKVPERKWNNSKGRMLPTGNYLDPKPDELGNIYMKAVTKAKRRATLSICGLGVMDESEIENAQNAQEQRLAEEEEKKQKITNNLKEAAQEANQSADSTKEEKEPDEPTNTDHEETNEVSKDEPDSDLSSGKSKMAYQVALQKLKDCQTLDELEGSVKAIADEATQQGISDSDKKELNKQYKAIKEQLTNGEQESSGSQSTEQSGQDQS